MGNKMTDQATNEKGMVRWPDFYVVGAPKCGTTSLYHYLRIHPQIFLPDVKEPHYFGSDLVWRKRIVPRVAYRGYYQNVPRWILAGDMSVFYLLSKNAPREIYEARPDAKIVALVRDPMTMVPSMHRQALKTGGEVLTDLADALAAEAERREKGSNIGRTNPGLEQMLYYSEVARYSEQIGRYFAQFGRENVLVVFFEDFVSDTRAQVARICAFLNVKTEFEFRQETHNAGRAIKFVALWRLVKHPPAWARRIWRWLLPDKLRGRMLQMVEVIYSVSAGKEGESTEVKAMIREMYLDDVLKLEAMLDRDLSHWLKV